MGLFGGNSKNDGDEDADCVWGGGRDPAPRGRHHGGNLHGNPKAKPSGKHGKAAPAAKGKGGKK